MGPKTIYLPGVFNLQIKLSGLQFVFGQLLKIIKAATFSLSTDNEFQVRFPVIGCNSGDSLVRLLS